MTVSNCMNWTKLILSSSNEQSTRSGTVASSFQTSYRRALSKLEKPDRKTPVANGQDSTGTPVGPDNSDPVNALLEAFQNPDGQVHTAAGSALQKNPERDFITAGLVRLLGSPDPAIRNRVATLLTTLEWSPANAGEEAFFAAAKGQFVRAAALGAPAIAPLQLAMQTADPNLRPLAVEAMGRVRDTQVLPALLEALHSSNTPLIVAAIRALGLLANPGTFESVATALKHEDPRTRLAAIDALPRADPARASAALTSILQDSNWDIRRAAAEWLGKLHNPDAVAPLIQSLADPDADVRETAAIALGTLRDRRAIGPLVMALKDPTSGVRRIAAKALLGIDDNWHASGEARAAVEELKQAMHDKNPDVRYAVGRLLQSFGITPLETIRYLPELAYYYELQQSLGALASSRVGSAPEVLSVTDLEKRRKLATTLMMATLCDADSDLRRAAAHSLGRLGDPRAESALRRAASDPNSGVRESVESSLEILSLVRRNKTPHTSNEQRNTSTSPDIGKLCLAGSSHL